MDEEWGKVTTDDVFDIVAADHDAGGRLGDVIEQDAVAVPLAKEEREVVVAGPDCFEVHGRPHHPRDLVHHRCIGWRPSPSAAPYRWEFEEDGTPFDVGIEPKITPNDLHRMVRTALADGVLPSRWKTRFAHTSVAVS